MFNLTEICKALACDNAPRPEVDHVQELAITGTDGSVPAGGSHAEDDTDDGEALPRFGVCPGCMTYLPAWSSTGFCQDCV